MMSVSVQPSLHLSQSFPVNAANNDVLQNLGIVVSDIEDTIDQLSQTQKNFAVQKALLKSTRSHGEQRNLGVVHLSSKQMTQNIEKKINAILNREIVGIQKGDLKNIISNEFFYKESGRQIDGSTTVDVDEITFLHRICCNMPVSVLNFFIPSVTDINLPSRDRWTPLMYALFGGQEIGFVKVLIDHGADVRRVNPDNFFTALHICLLQKKIDAEYAQKMHACLVERGARMISPTFLKALDNEATQHVLDLFRLSPAEIQSFCQEVKKAGARELLDALDLYRNTYKTHSPNLLIFELLKNLKDAGNQAAEVAEMNVKGRSPFKETCTLFKPWWRMAQVRKNAAVLSGKC